MGESNERAGDGGALGKLPSEAAQPAPAISTPMRTPSFPNANSAVRREHERYYNLFAEAIRPIEELTQKFAVSDPELLPIAREIEQTISDLLSQTIALTNTYHPAFPNYAIMTKLDRCMSLITRATNTCDSLLDGAGPKRRLLFRLTKSSRMRTKALRDVQSTLTKTTNTLELLRSYMTIAAALEQKSEERVTKQGVTDLEQQFHKHGTTTETAQAFVANEKLYPLSHGDKVTVPHQAYPSPGQHEVSGGRMSDVKEAIDKWCSPTSLDYDNERHKYLSSRRLDGTCDWFIRDNKRWQKWLGDEASSSILCWGAPGVGKSTIASRVIDELRSVNPPVAYAFCYLGDCGTSSPERLIQSLLLQLGPPAFAVPRDSGTYMSNHCSLVPLPTKDTETDIVNDVAVHSRTGLSSYYIDDISSGIAMPSSSRVRPIASFQDALEAITMVIEAIGRDVFIVIDAWEKEKMELRRENDFMDLLRTLRSTRCRVFLTSCGKAKPEPDSTMPFDISLPISEADIRGDVESLIQRRMSDMFVEYFRAPKFTFSIGLDPLKNLLGSFTLATLFICYVRDIFGKSKAFWSQTILDEMSTVSFEAFTSGRLLVHPAGIGYFEPERLIKASIEHFSTGLSSIQSRSILVWLTFAASPLRFEDLCIALRHISDDPQATGFMPNLSITKQIRDEELDYEYLRSTLIQLDGLVLWDRGNQLTQLTTKEVGKAVQSLWFPPYHPNQTLRSVSGLEILGRICIYCIQYILSVELEEIGTLSEKLANQLSQRSSFLSHAVLNWSRYCREFNTLMRNLSPLHGDGLDNSINQTELGRNGRDQFGGSSYNTQLRLEIVGLKVDTPRNQFQGHNKYLQSLHREISARVSELIEDEAKVSMAILLDVYLNPDISASNDSWEELHSWVTSMPQLLMASHLGLDQAVKEGAERHPERIFQSDNRGNTALHQAAKLGFEDVVCTLLSAGAPMKALNHSNQTPARYALMHGQTRAFVLIFEKMASDDMLDGDDERTYDYCDCIVGKQSDHQRSLDLSLFHAIEKSHIPIVRHLLNCGANPNGLDDKNTPVIHHAIRYGEDSKNKLSYLHDSCLDLLLRQGADPDMQSEDTKKESSLHVAVRWKKLGTIRWLLRYGVDPNQVDSEGRTPLFAVFDRKEETSESECSEIVRLLLMKGADPNQNDFKGNRVYPLARRGGFPAVAKLLVDLGANVDHSQEVNKPDQSGSRFEQLQYHENQPSNLFDESI
ncbi:hypothetical protein NPX13_g3088 [Xylaria arbuscula]|uniref:Nephrocystin 3-like N-terminal domain-containing protein n=1 Tax=Xylaria arbuscula TaxID=114810 RepID=A0A9W8TPV2_9PEZI|nr:hypothetical protein NPX13_g3088 [Xylaria arbuscula]